MDKKKGIFQRIADFAKDFFAKDRITSSYTNHYGETTSKTHRRSFETTNERLLNQIGKMKEKETLVLDRNGHFIHLDKNSTKKDLDMFLKSSNQVASIEKQNYSTWEKIKNTYNNRFEKKDIPVTFTNEHGVKTDLTNRTMTRKQAKEAINEKIGSLQPGQHLSVNVDGKIHHLNHKSKSKEVSHFFNNTYPTKEVANVPTSLSVLPGSAAVLNQDASERQINFSKQSMDNTRSTQTNFRDTAFINESYLEKELTNLKAGEKLTISKNGEERVFSKDSKLSELQDFAMGTDNSNIKHNDKHLNNNKNKELEVENARTNKNNLKTAALATGAGLATAFVSNKVSDSFLVKLAAVAVVTVATAYIADKYFNGKDFSFNELANKDQMQNSFENAKDITNNPDLKVNDIKPDTWLQVDRDTALTYSKNSTPVIKEGNDYFVGLKAENMTEKQMDAHLELLGGKELEKSLDLDKEAEQQLSIA